jgi:hypothetical protein
MFNCEHCQKKYKRSWHQARHSQMKHENSNASTATTSSAGTPPTPEINGNIPSSNNYNYQQLQQVPQMPSQPLAQDINHISPMQQQHLQNVAIPPANNWDQMAQHPIQQQQQALPMQQQNILQNHQLLSPQLATQQHLSPDQQLLSPQQIMSPANQQIMSPANQQTMSPANQQIMSPQPQANHHQHHAMYPATEMTDSTKNFNASQSVPQQNIMQNGEFINYAVNEQYSSKFEQVQAPPVVSTGMNPSPYDSWVSFIKHPEKF